MKKNAFIFPGQGAQYPGMGVKLYENYQEAKQLYNKASNFIGFDLLGRHLKDDPQGFFLTTFGQPSILALSVIAYRIFSHQFKEPSFLAGHSLGEYSALVCSEAIELHDALSIVCKRAQIMESMKNYCQGGMCAIDNCKPEIIELICRDVSEKHGIVVLSNYNSKKQCVISGLKESVRVAGDIASKSGGLVRALNLDIPFHSPLLKTAVKLFENELFNLEIRMPKYPVISNVTALPYQNVSEIRHLLAVQIMQPVKWLQTMEYLSEHDVQHVIEFGPKQVLKKFYADSFSNVQCVSVEHETNHVPSEFTKIQNIKNKDLENNASLKKASTNEDPQKGIKKCLAIVASTKTQNSSAQPKIVLLNDELKSIKQELIITTEHLEKAKQILQEILVLKNITQADVRLRLDSLGAGMCSNPNKKIQLFCFPYAGGSTSIFKDWEKQLSQLIEVVPVEYPGRGTRHKEPLCNSISELLSILLPEIESKIHGPFALFGHSLGAIVAYEISKLLMKKNKMAQSLILSGCPAPSKLKEISSIKGLSDREFLDKISSLNGTPPELLSKEEFHRFFIPILRSDFSLLDDYLYVEDSNFDIPLTLYGGLDDLKVTPDSIQNWKYFTKGSTKSNFFEGDHFFIKKPIKMLEMLSKDLCLTHEEAI